MLNFINPGFHFFPTKTWKPYALSIKKLTIVTLFCSLILLSKSFGQAGDLSQIRNGSGKTSSQGVLDVCGDCWVNGNAGSSNAHYVEGMSIAYRSLLTGLSNNHCYEYELGYDTYHGAMAIDYLTHFQRLEPHQPFGHPAEVINPLIFVNGSTNYTMHLVDAGPNTFTIPAPDASGIASGAFNADGTPKNISNQPATSFGNLSTAEKQFTIYNGQITNIIYVSQPAITIGGADKETRVRIRFTAHSDSVVLAWGGHIASRLDWGYTKDNKGKLSPLSAGGISGSPYHMRQKAFDEVDCGFNTDHVITSFSGFGNTDRSLSAAAVVAPPTCPTVSSQTICAGSSFAPFTISNAVAGTTYEWTISNNTAGAQFTVSAPVTGTSVSVTTSTPGSFTLDIKATLNSIDLTCPAVATGTVNPNPTANAGTAPAAQCRAINGNTFTLNGTASNGTPSWSTLTNTNNFTVSFGSANSATTTVTLSGGTTSSGSVTFRLSVASASCGTATSNVTATVNAQPAAPNVTYNPPACDATTFSVTINSPIAGATYSIKNACGLSVGVSDVVASTASFTFSGIPTGSGFQVTVVATGSCSAQTTCGTCHQGARVSSTTTEINIGSETTVKAYPNPFSDRVKFLVNSEVAGRGSLEIYNMMGQKVRTVYQGFIQKGTQTFELSLPTQQISNLVYVLRVGDKKMSGKLLQINR